MLSQPLIREIKRIPKAAPHEGPPVEAQGLAAELRHTIEGEVRFDDGSRALYAAGGANYRQVPIGVVIPKSIESGWADLQRRSGDGYVEVPASHCGAGSTPQTGAGATRARAGRSATRGRAVSLNVCARSIDP